ncbi:hypothetical protein BC826DRAFT_1013066 [Russula brevipes]|nr:hypothetical protein BC826DRAFT_1013066 [Russula brevipes]
MAATPRPVCCCKGSVCIRESCAPCRAGPASASRGKGNGRTRAIGACTGSC